MYEYASRKEKTVFTQNGLVSECVGMRVGKKKRFLPKTVDYARPPSMIVANAAVGAQKRKQF